MEKISWLDYEEAELHGGWPDQRIGSGWAGSGRVGSRSRRRGQVVWQQAVDQVVWCFV